MGITKGQKLYYVGIGYGIETFCYEIIEINGARIIHTNDGVKRNESDVINGACDLYVSKELANTRLSNSWMARMIP